METTQSPEIQLKQVYGRMNTQTLQAVLEGFTYDREQVDSPDYYGMTRHYLDVRIRVIGAILDHRAEAEAKDPVEVRLERQRRNEMSLSTGRPHLLA